MSTRNAQRTGAALLPMQTSPSDRPRLPVAGATQPLDVFNVREGIAWAGLAVAHAVFALLQRDVASGLSQDGSRECIDQVRAAAHRGLALAGRMAAAVAGVTRRRPA
ncbi:hypothetical protein [Ralstonia solanacearum]|uniref:hypothetical protein n=1 Tax=Ralstonia solanacearum TaxID=305 RepID=UPI0035EB5639